MKIREIRSLDELQSLSGKWDSLLGSRGEEVLTSNFAWISRWWSCIEGKRELRVLVAEDGGEIVGIAPLYSRTHCRGNVVPVRVLSFIGHEFSDYGSFLMKGDRDAVCSAFLKHLKNRPDWHQLRLHNMPSTNGDFDRVSRLGAGLGYELDAAESGGNRCFYVRTEGDFDEYFKKLSHNLRHDVAKRQRRLNEAGGFELKFTGEIPLTDLLDAVATIHAKRQHDLERSSFFERGAQADFVREILAVYAQKGWLDYAVMTIGGRVAAYRVGFRYRGVLYDWNTAFDPEYNSFSVGKVLLYSCIKKAFERQDVQEFNFMRGESEYKQKYTSDFRWNSNFVSRRPGSLYARGVSIAEEVWRTGKKRWFREQILPPAQ